MRPPLLQLNQRWRELECGQPTGKRRRLGYVRTGSLAVGEDVTRRDIKVFIEQRLLRRSSFPFLRLRRLNPKIFLSLPLEEGVEGDLSSLPPHHKSSPIQSHLQAREPPIQKRSGARNLLGQVREEARDLPGQNRVNTLNRASQSRW